LYDEDASALELVTFGRLAEIDGQPAVEHDENLLLHLIRMTPTAGAGWIAPIFARGVIEPDSAATVRLSSPRGIHSTSD
jgi:hypothetical protein